jgi:hypothetical protein
MASFSAEPRISPFAIAVLQAELIAMWPTVGSAV